MYIHSPRSLKRKNRFVVLLFLVLVVVAFGFYALERFYEGAEKIGDKISQIK